MKMMTLYHHQIQREISGLIFLKTVLILKVIYGSQHIEWKVYRELNKSRRIIIFFMPMSYFCSVSYDIWAE